MVERQQQYYYANTNCVDFFKQFVRVGIIIYCQCNNRLKSRHLLLLKTFRVDSCALDPVVQSCRRRRKDRVCQANYTQYVFNIE